MGEVQFFIYRDKNDEQYTAVCLTFDIIEKGNNLEILKKSIEEAAKLHIETVVENNLSDKLLNRSAPKRYWKKLYDAMCKYENLINDKPNPVQPKIQTKRQEVSDIWNRSSRELVAA